MYVGLLVLSMGKTQLRSGASVYSCAVVACVNPLKLTSLEGDMLWSAIVSEMELHGLCEAHPKYVENGQRRLEKEERSLLVSSAKNTASFEDQTADFKLEFVARGNVLRLFPEHASVFHDSTYQLFYSSKSDMFYIRRPWQSWVAPLGKDYNLQWFKQVKQAVFASQSPVRFGTHL